MTLRDTAIIIFENRVSGESFDIETPLSITANDLIHGLATAFGLEKLKDPTRESYLKAENPIALIRGSKTLAEMGLHNATTVFYEG